jgi:hypothetical protein
MFITSERISKSGITLPTSVTLTSDQCNLVIKNLLKIIQNINKRAYQYFINIMNILIVATGYPDGKVTFLMYTWLDWQKHCIIKGMQVHVLAPHAKDIKKEEVVNGIKIHRFQYYCLHECRILDISLACLKK